MTKRKGAIPPVPAYDAIRQAIEAAPRIGGVAAEPASEPAFDDPFWPTGRDTREKHDRWHKTKHVIEPPDDLPIQCLGLNGDVYFYLDGQKQLRAVKAGDHGRLHLLGLFGRHQDWLLGGPFGVFDKAGIATGKFKAEVIQNMLFHACNQAGLLDPLRQVRGVGAWLSGDGSLVVHQGDRVFIAGLVKAPDRYGEHVYPAYPPTPRPHKDRQNSDAGQELLSILRTWHWSNPLHALLVLGWIGQGYVAGAVGWRTHMIGDGERGSGKSTLMKLFARVYGSWLLSTSDTTAAALYQLMGGRAQPVAIDEFEAGDNPQRKQQVIQVLRQASSGGIVQRGGDNHVGRQFSAQFPAFLTAITPISLQPQDESRMVRVKLLELEGGARAPELAEAAMAELGARLMRRMRDEWPTYQARLDGWKYALEAHAGFDARMQDTYGVLLACADMLLYDHGGGIDALEARLQHVEDVSAALAIMVAPARAEDLADQARCLNHLLNSTLDRGGGLRRTVASWVRQAKHGHAQLVGGAPAPELDGGKSLFREAAAALGTVGLRFMLEKDGNYLFVANSHPALMRIFDATPWPGLAGAAGAWAGTLRRLPSAAPTPNAIKVGGSTQRGTLVPIDGVVAWEDDE